MIPVAIATLPISGSSTFTNIDIAKKVTGEVLSDENNKKILRIAKIVNEMIPEKWGSFHCYAQVSETVGGTYFFYNIPDKKEFIYNLDISSYFNIDKNEFNIFKLKIKRNFY